MATKLAAIDTPAALMASGQRGDAPKAAKTVKRSPAKIAVTFGLVARDGTPVEIPAGAKLVVQDVFRDMARFADRITEDPTNIPLFAKIEVPFQS